MTPGKPRNSTENSPRNSTRKLRFNTLNGLREEGYSLPEGSQGARETSAGRLLYTPPRWAESLLRNAVTCVRPC